MPTSFPGSLHDLTNPTPSTGLATQSHSGLHSSLNDLIEAIQNKLGFGSANQAPGAGAGVLRRTAAGQSEWNQILAADIGAQQVIGGKLGPQSVGTYELADGQVTNGKIADGTIFAANKVAGLSINNGLIAAQTIRGGVDGGNSKIVPASLNTTDLAAGTVTQQSSSPQFTSTMGISGPWVPVHGNAVAGLNFTAGGYALAIFMGSVYNSGGLGSVSYIGLAIDTNYGVTGQYQVAQGNTNCNVPFCVILPLVGLSGGHNIYGVGGSTGGNSTYSGQIFIVEWKR